MLKNWIFHPVARSRLGTHQTKPDKPPERVTTSGSFSLKLPSACRLSFPNELTVEVCIRPQIVDRSFTVQVILDQVAAQPVSAYETKDPIAYYGRCESLNLDVESCTFSDHALILDRPQKGGRLLSYFFQTLRNSVVEHQIIRDREVVNSVTSKKNVYPYGGYVGKEGAIGEPVYMMCSVDRDQTRLHLFRYSDLVKKDMDLNDGSYFVCGDLSPQSLESYVGGGGVDLPIRATINDQSWTQRYGSYEIRRHLEKPWSAILKFKPHGDPFEGALL
jgi:hypothetical protein